jgi:UDP-N-acetylmuramoyl-tripeptide--D-alanyl-D-alanine ligase
MNFLWTSKEVSLATQGQSNQEWVATGFTTDSRTLQPGDLFIALKGPVFDGHDYVIDALKKGAAAAIVSQDFPAELPTVRVKDTLKALEDLGRASRARTKAQIIAVTGSFGKTSTKEGLRLVLSHQGKVTANQRSYNNFWGLPLSLAQLPADHDYGIFEIGMNYPGEITPLSLLARPHVTIITNVEKMHIQNCGSHQGVADAKAEIFEGMAPGAKAVLNKDNVMFSYLEEKARRKGLEVISFGADPTAECRLIENTFKNGKLHVKVTIGSRPIEYAVSAVGEHWAYNSLAILSAVWALGANVELAAESLAHFQLLDGRGAVKEFPLGSSKITVIDESYNAGPGSMIAAIRTLGRIQPQNGARRIAVLGDMLELGEHSKELHRDLAEHLLANHVDFVYTTGALMKELHQVLPENKRYHEDDLEILSQKVAQEVRPGEVIMIKGSRGMRAYRGRMSKIVDALQALSESQHTKKSA